MKTISYFFFLLIFSANMSSQIFDYSFYTSGKIITKSDTINCFIENKDIYSNMIKYKLSNEDKKVFKIKKDDVEHLIMSTKQFDKVAISYPDSAFLERMIIGEVSLYRNTFMAQSPVMFMTSADPNGFSNMYVGGYSSKEVVSYFIFKGIDVLVLKKKDFHERLKQLMSDNTEIQADIDKLKFKDEMFSYRLSDVINKYNFWFKYKKTTT
jgi:hypothetical protein